MPRILIIDDDLTTRLTAELVLCALGFEAETAENGVAGLAKMRELPPDLVICDIVMPEMDGFGVLAAAQEEPRLARVPFIFLSSLTDREVQRRGMSSGADDFLTKPFQPSELLDAIKARFRKVAAMGPDPAVLEAALSRLRGALDGQEQAVLGLLEPGSVAMGSDGLAKGLNTTATPPRTDYWIKRIRFLFEENNPEAIQYGKDEILSKKLMIHASYLLSRMFFAKGDRSRGDAEFAIAYGVLRMNAESIRSAINARGDLGQPGKYRGLRMKFLRLERKLEELRKRQAE